MAPHLSRDNFSGVSSWILDSSASRHMTGHRDFLLDVVHTTLISITLPNRSETLPNCEGSISFSSKFLLENLHYVPNLTCHLVSLSQFIHQHPSYYVSVVDDCCVIQDRTTGMEIGAGR